MIRRAATAVALLTLLVPSARAEERAGWQQLLPAGWLAVVVADSPSKTAGQLDEILAPWDRQTDWLFERFGAILPDPQFPDRPWALALVEADDGSLAPLLLAPTDDFAALCVSLDADVADEIAALCVSLDADVADEIAVAVVGGLDIALIDRGGWAQVTLLDSTPTTDRLRTDPDTACLDRLADCGTRLVISPRGLDRLAEALTARRRGQLRVGRGRVPRWAWPNGFNALVDRLAPYAPLAERFARFERPLAIGVRHDDGGDWVASFALPAAAEPSRPSGVPANPNPLSLPAGERIASLRFADRLPDEVIDLAISWMRCRPDEIDAPEYPQPQWDDLADAYRQLLRGCRGAACGLMLPGEGEPVAANQAAAFFWDGDADPLGETLALTTVRWNQVVEAAQSRTPLQVAIEPRDPGGWRLSTDLFTGFAVERSPEIEALFERCYGGDTLSLDVKPTGSGTWLAFMGPARYGKPATADGRPLASGSFLEGKLRLDRWFAWQQQVEDATRGDVVGRRVRPPMNEAPPAKLRATASGGLRIDAALPAETYQAAAAYWRAKKVRPDAKAR